MGTSAPVRRTTSTSSTSGHCFSASSTLAFSGTILPPRRPSSAVMTTLESQSWMRPAMRVGREAAEDHRMDRADPGAGQHGVGRLGDHRQVDGDPVALLDAVRLQHIGHAADLGVGLGVGDLAAVGRIVALPDDRDVVGAVRQVAVEAVGRDVQHPVGEPADAEVLAVEGDVLDLGEGLRSSRAGRRPRARNPPGRPRPGARRPHSRRRPCGRARPRPAAPETPDPRSRLAPLVSLGERVCGRGRRRQGSCGHPMDRMPSPARWIRCDVPGRRRRRHDRSQARLGARWLGR